MDEKPSITPAAASAMAKGDLLNAAVALAPGGIEAQEKVGQDVFVASETLPIRGTSEPAERAWFEKHGFVFGERADKLFVQVKFPPGWKKVATDHSMWSDLVDAEGTKRAEIFFKAAFYDRDSFIRLSPEGAP